MTPKFWFLIEIIDGKIVIVSEIFKKYEDARNAWDKNLRATICETVYG